MRRRLPSSLSTTRTLPLACLRQAAQDRPGQAAGMPGRREPGCSRETEAADRLRRTLRRPPFSPARSVRRRHEFADGWQESARSSVLPERGMPTTKTGTDDGSPCPSRTDPKARSNKPRSNTLGNTPEQARERPLPCNRFGRASECCPAQMFQAPGHNLQYLPALSPGRNGCTALCRRKNLSLAGQCFQRSPDRHHQRRNLLISARFK